MSNSFSNMAGVLALIPERFVFDNFECAKIKGAVRIEKYIGSDSAVEIPALIENLPVTEIGGSAFSSYKKLTQVLLRR